jgi:hypothetical protein
MMKRLLIVLAAAIVATGAMGQVKDFADNFDHTNCFQAPPGSPTGVPQLVEDFSGGIPGTWTVIDTGVGGCAWTVTGQTNCVLNGNWTNGSGPAACANSDFTGSATVLDTEMITECYNYSGASNSELCFSANYRDISSDDDLFEIDYAFDGATWTNLLSWDATHGIIGGPTGEDHCLATAVLDGAAGVQFRYHYYDFEGGGWDWYIQVDDISLESDGAITTGGNCTGGGDGGGGVPATTGIGVALMVLILGGGGAYFMRRK